MIKRFLSMLLIAAMLLGFDNGAMCLPVSEKRVCSCCGDEETLEVSALGYGRMLEDGAFKVLFIGNGFTLDAAAQGQTQLLDILQAMLGSDVEITIGTISSAGKTMTWHATQAERGEKSYSMSVITGGGSWRSLGTVSSAEALSWTDWDAVSLQPYDAESVNGEGKALYPEGEDEKFYPLAVSTAYMLDRVAEYAPNAEAYELMPWVRTSVIAYESGAEEHSLRAAFFPDTLQYAGAESKLRYTDIVPVGSAIQNAKTSYLALLDFHRGSEVNLTNDPQVGLLRDGLHVSFNVGRYIAALTCAETMIPESLRQKEYTLPEIRVTESIGQLPKEYTLLAQTAVQYALTNWRENGSLAVQPIKGHETDPARIAANSLEGAKIHLQICAREATRGALRRDLEQRLDEQLSVWPELEISEISEPSYAEDSDVWSAELELRYGYTEVTLTVSGVAEQTQPHVWSRWLTLQEADCTTSGIEQHYCTGCGLREQRELKALGHDWGKANYTWSDDLSEVTAERVCKRDGDHIERETVKTSSEVTKEPSYSESGEELLTAVFSNPAFSVQSRTRALPALELPDFSGRIYGPSRYETSLETAEALKQALRVDAFESVVVASGRNFADALAGSTLAIRRDAPILLVDPAHTESVKAWIRQNLCSGGTVYLLGGEAAVGAEMESDLDEFSVIRLWGRDRFGTNLAILREIGVEDGEPILVCDAYGFADSLSASAAGLPILLVGNELNDEQIDYLEQELGGGHLFFLIGGDAAVKPAVAEQCAAYGETHRIGGRNRYETSRFVAEAFVPAPAEIILSYGLNFPDGLCGAPLAYALNAPLLLATNLNTEEAARYAREKGVTEITFLGGPALISDEAIRSILGDRP